MILISNKLIISWERLQSYLWVVIYTFIIRYIQHNFNTMLSYIIYSTGWYTVTSLLLQHKRTKWGDNCKDFVFTAFINIEYFLYRVVKVQMKRCALHFQCIILELKWIVVRVFQYLISYFPLFYKMYRTLTNRIEGIHIKYK